MKIKRISPLSLAKISGLLLAILGFFLGVLIAALTLVASLTQAKIQGASGYFAIIVLPVVYGVLGFVLAFIQAWLFNIIAKKIGGLEIEVE
ncbi:MAG TPA: hypothetical protein PLH56_02550 [Candidatus Omnitrophota bacterium]|nr:hypothetical protein [Candidatus Omnitrophota bacterium]